MTTKQKSARQRFKAIQAEAKKLRKKNPKLTQAEAVKQAWTISYTKKRGKKIGDYNLNKSEFVETTIPISPRKNRTKRKNQFAVERQTDGTFKKIRRIGGTHKDTKSHNVNIRVVSGILSGFFDTSVIKEIDQLKKEYFKLAKKYHPDAGGTTLQFQQLNAEYEKLLKNLLNGSDLTQDQKENEIVIDEAIRKIVDELINIEGLNIELIGKWLWISGQTYPVRNVLKSAGLVFIKKEGVPYWVYKGIESSSRGKTSMEEIKRKYGVFEMKPPKIKKLNGTPLNINKSKLKIALKKLVKGLNKRPV